jgi:hypothetical protein
LPNGCFLCEEQRCLIVECDINGTTVQTIKSDGRTQWVTDARGFITRQELDEWDNIIKTVYPDESWKRKGVEKGSDLCLTLAQ